jgi:hypothetical protein
MEHLRAMPPQSIMLTVYPLFFSASPIMDKLLRYGYIPASGRKMSAFLSI